jgi:hypothetical protein
LVSAREALEPKGELEETAGVVIVSFVDVSAKGHCFLSPTCTGELSAQGPGACGRVIFGVVEPDEVGDPAGKVC